MSNRKVLLIDDLRDFLTPPENMIIARTSQEALNILNQEDVSFKSIWFDHDLGIVDGNEDTTMPVVMTMCEKAFNDEPIHVETIYVHTANPVGRDNIYSMLNRFYPNVKMVYDLKRIFTA